jgi:hypothetical protein
MLKEAAARAARLLSAPRDELLSAIADSGATVDVLVPYVLVLAAIGPVASFLSAGLLGVYHPPTTIFNTTLPGGYTRAPGLALVQSVTLFAIGVAAWWLLALLLCRLAPRFGGQADPAGANKAAACMLTPVWVGTGLFLLASVPYLGALGSTVGVFGGLLYGVLIGTWAVPPHLGVPEARAPGHVLVALGATVVFALAAYVAATALLNLG